MLKRINRNETNTQGVFHLSDLRIHKYLQSEQFYFRLKERFGKRLFENAVSVAGNIKNLANILSINYYNLWDSINRSPISLSNLIKISSYLIQNNLDEFSLEKIERNISYMKGGFTNEKIFNPKFPIVLSTPEGMRFISHLYHDGSIGTTNRQPHYRNQSFDECREFLEDSKRIFGIFNRTIKRNKDFTYSVHLPTIIGDVMISIGYFPGDKTKNNNPVFSFLRNIESKILISEFLAKAFNDDGYVSKRGIGLSQSSLIRNGIMEPSNVLMMDKLFLEKLDIKVNGPSLSRTYLNRYGPCTTYSINVYSKDALDKFRHHIKLIDYKMNKLKRYLNSGYKIKKIRFINP